MLIIKDYGVELHELTRDKIELVRNWRNSDKIKRCMSYRDEITSNMQEQWFEKISHSDNQFYFIINVDGRDVGLINIKNVDWDSRIGESGIFIYSDEYLHTGVSYRAALCQQDFAFNVLRLSKIYGHILNTNTRSINYNKKFGFELAEPEINITIEKNQLYTLSKENYFHNKNKIINMLSEKYNLILPVCPE